jgi:hypothetical protein
MPIGIETALRICGEETQDDWVTGVVAAGAASTTQVVSGALIQPGASSDLYVGSWVLFPNREHYQRERVVDGYTPGSGILSIVTNPLATPTVVGEHFQDWTRFRPVDVERALLAALKNMFQARATPLTGAAIGGLRQVNLTAALPWLRSSNQVLAVSRYDGSVPSAQEFVTGGLHVSMSSLADAAPVVALSVQGDGTFSPSDTITVYTWASWRDATADWADQFLPADLSTGTTEAPEEWWAWEGLYRLSRQTQYRDPDLEQRAINELNRLRPYFSPESGYRAFEPRESWGPSGLMGY